MFPELWCDYCRLVFHIEVSQVLVLEWVSPTVPDLSILPPPCDLREEGGLRLWTWPALHVRGMNVLGQSLIKKKIKGIFGDELILAFWQMTVKVTKINIEHTYFHLFTITIYNALT